MAGRKRKRNSYNSYYRSGKSSSGKKKAPSVDVSGDSSQSAVHRERMKELSESGVSMYSPSTRTERMLNKVKRKQNGTAGK